MRGGSARLTTEFTPTPNRLVTPCYTMTVTSSHAFFNELLPKIIK